MPDKIPNSSLKRFVKCNLIGTQHEWESHINNMICIFDRNLQAYAANNMLDVGCGDGSRTTRIAEYFRIPMEQVYGLDVNDELIGACRRLFKASKIDLETDPIPYQDGVFDLVICNQVLEHLKNYREVIDSLTRVTKKGGFIVIGIPNLAHLINRLYLLFGIQPMCIHLEGPHVRSFAHRDFKRLITSLRGLRLLDCKGSLMYPLPLFMVDGIMDRFVGLCGYVCYLLRKIE